MTWQTQPGAEDCDECSDLYDGSPPCEECQKPRELYQENLPAMKLWHMGHSQRGALIGVSGAVMAAITIEAAHHLCLIYDAPVRDFEKIILIDKLMLPYLREQGQKGE